NILEIVPGQKIQNIFSPVAIQKIEQALTVIQQTGTMQAFEYKQTLSDREHWFDARLVPLSESQLIFTARDVTTCRETEKRIKHQVQKLSVLRSIDLAIASGLDLNLLLAMLLDQVNELM